MKKHSISIMLFICISVLINSCTNTILKKVYPTLNDGKYDSEFPYQSSSKQLEEISKSVKLVNVLTFYKSYFFDEKEKITLEDIDSNFLEKVISESKYYIPASGTATIILSSSKKVELLSCAHIVDSPDSIITYFDQVNKKHIESFSLIEKKTIYIPGFPGDQEIEIEKIDKTNDLVLLSKDFAKFDYLKYPAINYKSGKAKDLEWGSFVYAFGFPLGQKMISKGIVSNPNKDGNGSFYTDIVANRGFSGGVVLAIKDGIPNFEIVGLIRSTPAEYDFILRPENSKLLKNYNPILPYTGEIFIDQQKTIKYGVTKIIPIEVINEFLNKDL